MFQKPFYNFLYSLFLVGLTAYASSYFNRIGMEKFYSNLTLSVLNPPDYVFPVVWLILYVMLIISFDRVLNYPDKQVIRPAAQMFTLNMFLQVVWCYVFFGNAYFLVGFAILVLLNFVNMYMIKQFYSLDKLSAWLLIPYQLWLLFAAYLNWAVVDLNGITYNFS